MQGGSRAAWRGQSCLAKQICAPPPFSLGSWAARSEWPGQERFRPPSLRSTIACLIPGGPGLAALPPHPHPLGSLLYIFKTSFYSS